jgi:xylulokinase
MSVFLGLDIGSSAIKCSALDLETGIVLGRASSPADEMAIDAPRPGWAEQHPDLWWQNLKLALQKLVSETRLDPKTVRSIGVSYQMHGLVLVDKDHQVLRPSIIWCDSRAVEIGKRAFKDLGPEFCLSHLLNSPGNFTASKLRWVKENEPQIFGKVNKIMLPGDYIAYKLTGAIGTTISGLSEGIFWDFQRNAVSSDLLDYYEIDSNILPTAGPSFSVFGSLKEDAANELGLSVKTTVTYRAGDQPNNAFSLRVLEPGEIAATAGTSGVVYGIIDDLRYDSRSRVNQFAHVNHSEKRPRLGVLLCINGTGILYAWLRKNMAGGLSYSELNGEAEEAPVGSDGLTILPFGNGAERVLEDRNIGALFDGVDFNRHSRSHIMRAAQEGIAFSLKYGIDRMREMGLNVSVIRAGHANLFQSAVFRETLATVSGATIELFETDGADGAARGAAIGVGMAIEDVFGSLKTIGTVEPNDFMKERLFEAYDRWEETLFRSLIMG